MNEQPAPLWSDEQISEEVETLALGYKARHVLRRMRDGYEAMLSMACQTSPSEEATIARLTQANAELAAEVERLKAEAAVYISFEIDRFEHDEDGSRNGKRHYYARIRYQAMAGCDYEEE
jgi:flavin reductase (DIM6/NTAB) family NADH-FMN oxidoreductase RutF